VFPTATGTEVVDLVCAVARDGIVRELPAYPFEGPSHEIAILAIKAFPLTSGRVGLAAEDVTARERARVVRKVERRILEMVASGAKLQDTLTELVLAMEQNARPAIASVLLLSPNGTTLVHGAAPHLPDEYNRAIDGATIGPGEGSCGSAAALRRRVVVTDIETDPLWEHYRDLARKHGLRACWSTPIQRSDGRVLGTFALYYTTPRSPSPAELDLITRATHVAGIAIQRHELDEQQRHLAARLEAAREEERAGIAREIHDQLGQSLTAIKLDIAWIAKQMRAPRNDAPASTESLLERLGAASEMTDTVIHEVRRISADLRPGVLDDLGLLAAIEWQAQKFERSTGVPCTVRSNLGEARLERRVSTALFRILQESLTNVARHASATRVDVDLERTEQSLTLRVRDDGKGIDAGIAVDPTTLGLLGMRERARHVGGNVTVRRDANGGTLVSVEVPRTAAEIEAGR
jgi:signal transduction histidine kinase